jgi:hypothetical protein
MSQLETSPPSLALALPAEVRFYPYQIIAPQRGTAAEASPSLCDLFPALIPAKPYAADQLREGLQILPRAQALLRRHLQFNGPGVLRWMMHDVDQPDAYFAHRDGNVPPPNVIIINPANGHAHAGYLLTTPVARHSAARLAPLHYFGAVERGIARRIGADRRYTGLMAKNPLHRDWRVEWRRDRPYCLEELADALFAADMAPDVNITSTFGIGRNTTLFDELRHAAYSEARAFKRRGDHEAFRFRLEDLAVTTNAMFPQPLPPSEVRATVRSVVRWTWKHFTDAGFARRQSALGRRGMAKRWADHIPLKQTEPWAAEGISRATWYRQKRSKRLLSEGLTHS